MSHLPKDLVWRQSTVAALLRCPRRFQLEHVERHALDHEASGYARFLGTADHAALELVLQRANEGETPERQALEDVSMVAFEEAVLEAEERGERTAPEGIDAAMDTLAGERVERVLRLAADPRIHAIHWTGIELPFSVVNYGQRAGRVWRRRWRGTIDAVGVARRWVEGFGRGPDGEPAALSAGDEVVADWKTGQETALGRRELDLSVQLGVYGMALNRVSPSGRPRRYFLAHLRDVDPYTNPPGIAKRLPDRINPAYAEALGLPLEEAEKCRKGPKDADGNRIPKRIKGGLNPEWVAATSKPRGPVFHEAALRWPVVVETVNAAIRMAEAGLFPASGALTGQCPRCPYARACPDYRPQAAATANDHHRGQEAARTHGEAS